ncbi:hypothetical protein EVA_01970 [gut metagenome]|uniref:Uncharacterized protein n=1 Tax=gut metagenome TaxID=749906 RepID=J9H253_9ZZZZ
MGNVSTPAGKGFSFSRLQALGQGQWHLRRLPHQQVPSRSVRSRFKNRTV